MATPTLRALRDTFPRAQITGVLRPIIAELIDGAWGNSDPWFDDSIAFQKSLRSRLGLIRTLRAKRLDVLLLLTNSFWSAAVARLAGIPVVVGYDRDARGWLLTEGLEVPRHGRKFLPVSAVDYYLQVANRLGCDTSNRRMQLELLEHEDQLSERFWERVGFGNTIPTVVINSNAANSPSRVWPREKVLQLSIRLAVDVGCQVILHCGPAERDAANDIATQANHPRVASLGLEPELPIGLSKAVLAKSDVVVSTDSGARHLAIALDRPVVSLFGPTDSAWTQTYNVPEEIIQVKSELLECRPCYQSKCPLKHHRCMQDISVEQVLQAVRHQLRLKSAAA